MKKETDLLTLKEAAEYLGISNTLMWKIAKNRQIRYLRIGNRYKLRRQDLDDFIEKQYVTPITEEEKEKKCKNV